MAESAVLIKVASRIVISNMAMGSRRRKWGLRSERTLFGKDTIRKGHYSERTLSGKDITDIYCNYNKR